MRNSAAPAVIIDASNVCRDPELAPRGVAASWRRLEALVAALEKSSVAFSEVYVVADRSLRPILDEGGQQALRRLERSRRAEQVRFADERIVQLAFGLTSPLQGALIATQDEFDDFRRLYPEIETTGARAVRWRAGRGGEPVLRHVEFGTRTHQRMSRKEEEGELAQRRLRREDVQTRAVANYYRCANVRGCIVAKLWPDRLEELPRYDERDDRFICPSCESKLEIGDRRAPAVQVIVLLDDVEKVRLLLEKGADVEIGRVDAKGCIGLERHLPKASVATLSRRHLRLQLRGSDVVATDLDSKNGTSIRPRRDAGQQGRRLEPGVPERWALRDALILPGGITLERSGRRHPLVGRRPSDKTNTRPDVAPTSLVRPEGR